MAEVRRWAPLLRHSLAGLKGVWIEDKTYSIAVHYRHSREKKKARAAILEAAAHLGPSRLIGGKLVINILPEGAPHKGMALLRERERLHCDTALYLGDDVTDEDVFGLDDPGRLLTIRVGAKRSSAASYYLRSQEAVDDLLDALLDLRPATPLAGASHR
jgi:trehalose 6-phosphate phosphatase